MIRFRMFERVRHVVIAACLFMWASELAAEQIATSSTEPPQIGLSAEKLQDLGAFLQREVAEGKIAGAVALIARHGRVGYFDAVGQADLSSASPMKKDSLFRIASMTKAITSTAVMSLVEDGRLSLDDPVSLYLPELKGMRVLADSEGESMATEDSSREPTIHDFLTHRSGFTYGWFGPEKLDRVYREHQVNRLFVPSGVSLSSWVSSAAKVPLKFQPGSSWDYSISIDLLGRVVEVASGLTLDRFFYERFFRPLRMRDTYFEVPVEKASRLATLYTIDEQTKLIPVSEDPVKRGFLEFSNDYCFSANKFHSGGGGLVSSASDYFRFLQMLLNGGQLDGVRVLKRESVAAMTQNQIGDMQIPFPGHGDAFGFGFAVTTTRGVGTDDFSEGSFSWGGIFNTYYWVDPQEQLVAVLMTQLFPYDHLDTRQQFREMTYDAIDDSGFSKSYWYEPGEPFANPHFNGRQLRVNAAEVSVHPKFGSRSEPRSSGIARILIEEDLRKVRRADLRLEVWGGHPGTENKRVSVNGRTAFDFPEVGSAEHRCTHQYPKFNLRPEDLVNGHNALQFTCEQGETFWGHYIVDNAAISIGLHRDDARISAKGLSDFRGEVIASPMKDGSGFGLQLKTDASTNHLIETVDYEARYIGYDENGNRLKSDWHGMTKARAPYGFVGRAENAPYALNWETTMLPAQKGVQVRAIVKFRDSDGLSFLTPRLRHLEIKKRAGESVQILSASNVPTPFWSRAGEEHQCEIEMDIEPDQIVAAELHVVAWTGGPGEVEEYFQLNGHHLPIAEGSQHETVYSHIPIDPAQLRKGKNKITLLSDTTHHGIEILSPGPALVVRYREQTAASEEPRSEKWVRLSDAIDESAGGLACYRIETPSATYYLDKVGAGLSSMIDRDGNDWLGFHRKKGSGAAGEYRGFPNAVFKEAGSYFHAQNAGTDPCVTKVVENTPTRIVISADSDNGLWSGQYVFDADACTFTMTQKPKGHDYWVLYEGVPGGEYDDDDWWMTSESPVKRQLTIPHEGDIPSTEWIAFGDSDLERSVVLHHHSDDDSTDRFYQMQSKMTVFGFGRDGMKKLIHSVPQSFSIRFVETTDHPSIQKAVRSATVATQLTSDDGTRPSDAKVESVIDLNRLGQHALTHRGDAKSGKTIFQSEKAKCATCHKINKVGGEAGPDLTSIGNKFDRPHLIESLLYPSKQIAYGYETTTVLTVDGDVINGLAKEATADHIVLVDANNKRQRIAKDEIDRQSVSKVSLMPHGLVDHLTPEDFADLVAYLESRRSGQSRFGSGVGGPIRLPPGFEMRTVATGLSGATALEVAPDGRVFVCEQDGKLRIIENDVLLEEPFVELPVEMNWERGLIGVTVGPKFPDDPHVYVVYVTDDPYSHHRISRFTADRNRAVAGSEKVLLRGDDQSKFGGNVPAGHQGGGIHFGPDGKLYVGLGEQTAKTPSQKMDALQGKILRLNPDGTIPGDNPFLKTTKGKYQTIWAIGCRNPFTFAFNRVNGQMLINDVGGKFEEINPGVAGANYGWPKFDHGPTNDPNITDPIHIYPQSSINGGDFASPESRWPKEFRNRYFFADFVHGWIKTVDPSKPDKSRDFAAGIRRPVDLRFAPDGSLYVLLRNAWVVDDKFVGGTGALMKITYQGGD